mgnify:FL=1
MSLLPTSRNLHAWKVLGKRRQQKFAQLLAKSVFDRCDLKGRGGYLTGYKIILYLIYYILIAKKMK